MLLGNQRLLLVVTLTSASSLAYEVLLMRLFSIIQWPHFAFMIISLALLGYGVSGVVLALIRPWLYRHFKWVFIGNLLLFALSMPISFLVAQQIPFTPAALMWDVMQLFYLLVVYLILALPFFFAASLIGASLTYFKATVATVYAADLLGAAIGSAAIIALLSVVFPQQILLLLPVVVLLTGLIWAWQPGHYRFVVPIVIITGLGFIAIPQPFPLQLSPYKSLSQMLNVPDTQVVMQRSSPQGLLTVVNSKQTPLRYAPGLSIKANIAIPRQLGVFTDADSMTAITQFEGDFSKLAYVDQTTSALAYHLMQPENVLILGAGTGSDIMQALFNHASQVTGVEQNGQLIDWLQHDYADFTDQLFVSPSVVLHQAEARGYLSQNPKRYNLIVLSLLEGVGNTSGGLYSLAENYLYTEQAITQYLQHLKPNGFLSLTRWLTLPTRDMPKLLSIVTAVLAKQHHVDAAQRLILIRSWQTSTLLVKNGRITQTEINALKYFCQQRQFDLVYYPGIKPTEVNLYHKLKQPYLYQAVTALLGKNRQRFIDHYRFNIAAPTDDQPYFSQFFKWRNLPNILSQLGQGGFFWLQSGYLLLVIALIQAILVCLLLLVVPLWFYHKKTKVTEHKAGLGRVVSYFFILGLAFMFIEMAFIQKFVLILHHPVYAITTVLATFLLAAGLGSQLSARISTQRCRQILWLVVLLLSGLSLSYLVTFEQLASLLLQQNNLVRYLLAILLVAPLGICMGIPFPLALRQLADAASEWIPWAWGVNGFASVISPILATLLAMQFGFRVLLASAVILYLLAALCFPRLTVKSL